MAHFSALFVVVQRADFQVLQAQKSASLLHNGTASFCIQLFNPLTSFMEVLIRAI